MLRLTSMVWDAVMIVVSVVLFNHMGLCEAVERVIHYRFKVLSCVKCCSFWSCLLWFIIKNIPMLQSVTVSFIASYSSLWMELGVGWLSSMYAMLYEKGGFAEGSEVTAGGSTDKEGGDTESELP